MNTRRSTARREEGGVANERISLLYQVPIVGLEEEENVKVPFQEPQVPPELQGPEVPPIPQAPFVEGDMTN